jgi:uroporphyrinogen-III synthase
MSNTDSGPEGKVPILLLKTRSVPSDTYAERFSTLKDGIRFEPSFIPVLEHTLLEKGLKVIRNHLRGDRIGKHELATYGGMVFTSQRSVEAFAKLMSDMAEIGDGTQHHIDPLKTALSDNIPAGDGTWPLLEDIPIYVVGPATLNAVRSIPQLPSLQVFGAETGNGEALADYIMEHYSEWYGHLNERPPLLFPVGEQRRDTIPRLLMDPGLPYGTQIPVDEVVVYKTGVMKSFEEEFKLKLQNTENRTSRWVVVFSPTGCEAMLRSLNMLDPDTGKAKPADQLKGDRNTYIAAIGPTTRDHLRKDFGFEPDVCAERPSPEGVESAIMKYIRQHR